MKENQITKLEASGWEALQQKEHELERKYLKKRQNLAKRIVLCRKRAKRIGLSSGKKEFIALHLKELLKLQKYNDYLYREAFDNCLDLTLNIIRTLVANPKFKRQSLDKKIAKELEKIASEKSVKIRINPEDQGVIKKTLPIILDQSINSGQALIETNAGSLLIDIEVHFKIIEQWYKRKK